MTLRSESGHEEQINLETVIGQTFMSKFGEDARFYSSQQYKLVPQGDKWYAIPNLNAKNDTIYNEKLLSERVELFSGDRLAVGKIAKGVKKLELTISF